MGRQRAAPYGPSTPTFPSKGERAHETPHADPLFIPCLGQLTPIERFYCYVFISLFLYFLLFVYLLMFNRHNKIVSKFIEPAPKRVMGDAQ